MKTFIKWLRRIIITGLCIVIGIYGLSFLLTAPKLHETQNICMYDQKQEMFYQSNPKANNVSLNDVSTDFLASIIAIEDHRFYEHHGFDSIGILRALKTNILHQNKKEGASTITQQYARLLFLNNDKTWKRKITEAFLATRLEAHYDKDTILQGYINTVYFGHGIYGIENAAQYYFCKTPKELNLNEASLLAGVINGPEYYSPFKNINQSRKRQKVVLQKLVKYNYITQDKANTTLKTPLHLNPNPSTKQFIHYPYFKDTVINELKDLGFYEEKYIQQGLHIETTLDGEIQKELEKNVQKEIKNREELQLSSLIIDSHTGGVLGLIGGRDYSSSQFNRATHAQRQIGSTMKPILYYIALDNGFTPTTKFKSEPTTFKLPNGQSYSPINFNQKYPNNDITLAQAIAVSDNIYAVKTHLFLGEQALVNMLNQFGYKHVSPHPSLALGTLNTNMYHLSNIYTTFANEGIHNATHTIKKITTDSGLLLYEYKNEDHQLLNQTTTLILNQLLTSPFNNKFSTYNHATMESYQTKSKFACKTGSSPYDSLCIGYNPNYTILNWVGFDDNREIKSSLDSRIAKKIFQTMANTIEPDDHWYKPTSQIQQIPINPLTGDYQENGQIYWFKSNK